ncbi:CASP-like protein 4B3 [Bienertia sinuspersici]
MAMVYSATQVGIKGEELRTGKDVISPDTAVWIDFIGDQVMAYLLLSSASVGAMTTSSLRRSWGSHPNPTLDQATGAVAMSFWRSCLLLRQPSFLATIYLSTYLLHKAFSSTRSFFKFNLFPIQLSLTYSFVININLYL